MSVMCKRCESDDDFAKVSLFMMDNKRDLHPSFTTIDTITLLYSYIAEGQLIQAVDENDRVVGVTAYYHGTPEREFEDKEVAFVDVALSDRAYRGTQLFIKGLRFMIKQIMERHPEVQEVRLAALSENEYICKLYSKFATVSHKREGTIGEETIFCVKIEEIESFLKKFDKV